MSGIAKQLWSASPIMLGLAWALPCTGQTFFQDASRAFYFDLDIRDGDYSSWALNDLGTATGLRATIEVARLGKRNDWLPHFLITVQTTHGRYGVVLEAENWKPPIFISTLNRGKNMKDVIRKVGTAEKFSIDMDWGEEGSLIIRVGDGKPEQLPVSSPITSIFISASTGKLTMHSLELGRFAR